ncbi:MlaD family protein [Ferrimonas kyonanensis]|uniref:MlaD family protein n=1 Tax=Ferrimonas kyonanensis TaxID=364763 RepID=UPI0004847D55|nr:MlaD family protein [Ferrimonas kyonanensis]
MNTNQSPRVRRKKLLSPIWILPILAVILGAWLLFTYIKEQGTEIRIQFPNANGIEARKTLVKYQGLVVGMVREVDLSGDRSSVNVLIKMDHTVDDLLRQDTRFWLVSPKASITGVEGLDALFSGNYIAMKPGEGKRRVRFNADTMAPASVDGATIIHLEADKGGSLDAGSSVYYQQMKVGDILQSVLDPDTKKVQVTAQIDRSYAPLVKENSHFWNVSGLKADASLSGVKVELESLASLLTGGIAFDSPEVGEAAVSGARFKLYPDRKAATQDHFISFSADSAEGLKPGSKIRLRGVDIGELTDVSASEDGVRLNAAIRDNYRHLLVSGSEFWQVKGQLSFTGAKHIGNLLLGDFISVEPGSGDPQYRFELGSEAPDSSRDGIALTLYRDDAAGLDVGSPVRFKQLPVGEVIGLDLESEGSIGIEVWINAPYHQLVGGDSHFWLAQGLDISADLKALSVSSAPFGQLLNGGISFSRASAAKATASARYPLLDDFEQSQAPKPFWVRLNTDKADGLAIGAPVYYRQMEVGNVRDLQLKGDQFEIKLALEGRYQHLISDKTRFWKYSGVRISGSLTQFEIDTAAAMALLRGGIAFDNLDGDGSGERDKWLYLNRNDALSPKVRATVYLDADADIQQGAPVKYHQQQLGQVERLQLTPDLKRLKATLTLDPQWQQRFLVEGARFYVAEAQLGLTGTKNVANLVLGNHLSALPGTDGGPRQREFQALTEAPVPDEHEQSLRLVLTQSQLGSVKIGSPVLYRQITVGEVVRHGLASDASRVEITIELKPQYRHLVNTSSRFWNASGLSVKVGLFSGAEIHTESLDTLLMGGIAFATESSTNDSNQVKPLTRFALYEQAEKQWLNWQPSF